MRSLIIFSVLFSVAFPKITYKVLNFTDHYKTRLDTCHVGLENIDCSNREIIEFPKYIYLHNEIKSINFRHNNITEINSWTFFRASGVLLLDISYNHIHFVASQSFIGIENINTLILSNNRLESLPIQFLAGLKQLTYLDLSHNYLKVLLRDMFESTTQLKELKLSSNPLKTIDPDAFRYLHNLERLFLDNTYLYSLNENLFNTNPLINRLDLSHNLFRSFPNIYLPELRSLNIDYNHFCFLDVDTFPVFPKLNSLYINNQHGLKAIFQYAFNSMPNLKILQCNNNKELRTIDPFAFMTFPSGEVLNLEQLHMRNNNLKRVNSSLLNWSNLYYLDFRGNPWRCDCNIKWMHDLNVRQHFQENLVCQHPRKFKNKILSEINPEEMVCGPQMLHLSVMIFSVFFVFAICGLLTYLFYKILTKPRLKYTKVSVNKDKIEMEIGKREEP